MKTDARVKYTKQVLRKALMDCLEEKSINHITVKELCERAGVNRATFYSHYRDCYDMLQQIENQIIDEILGSLLRMQSLDTFGIVSATLDVLDKNQDLFQVRLTKRSEDSLVQKMVEIAREHSMELWKKFLTRASDEDREMLFVCITSGVLNVIMQFYGKCSREQMISFIIKTVDDSLRPYM